MLTKLFGVAVACLLAGRLFAPRKSELARRFRIFVDVCLVLVFVMYGASLLQMWI